MIPRYRLCGSCHDAGREERIGTQAAPLIQLAVGLLEDGLSYEARLPRFLWALWTRYRPEDDRLEPVPVKHELCVACFQKMVTAPGALNVLTQDAYRDAVRAAHQRTVAEQMTEPTPLVSPEDHE